ncbi:MAG: efflux RND transporter periplasmic adaptor subunit [Hyphomicrobiales bacterium]|nr:efflux RND transporter periplasmic adaptor subunit [Hyphomicrobiales bacterium]MDE2115233.1 efflux RND transporter periplasmic adaptor subunit [Hyphomicrobiales bacterium]
MRRAIIFILVFLFLGAISGGLAWFQFAFKPVMLHNIISKMVPPPSAVAVEIAKTENWSQALQAVGSFSPVQGINVAAQVGGIVKTLQIHSGAEVKKGTPLLQLDDSVEQADLKSNLATLTNNELSLSRQQQLMKTGNGTKVNLDAAVAARDSAAAAVQRVRATIDEKAIVAPFDGRLGLRRVDIGQYVSPGLSLVTLTHLDPLFVDFPVPEQNVGEVSKGQKVTIKVDAYADKTFEGTVESIDTRVDNATRAVTLRASVPNPDRKLLPGMFANVALDIGKPQDVVTVPRTAVTFSLYGDSVFLVVPVPAKPGEAAAATPSQDLTTERRFVRTGEIKGDRIAIVEGIKAGDRVITEGQIKIQPGAKVVVTTEGVLKPPAQLPEQ